MGNICMAGGSNGAFVASESATLFNLIDTTTPTGEPTIAFHLMGASDSTLWGVDGHGDQLDHCRNNMFSGDRMQMNPFTLGWELENMSGMRNYHDWFDGNPVEVYISHTDGPSVVYINTDTCGPNEPAGNDCGRTCDDFDKTKFVIDCEHFDGFQ